MHATSLVAGRATVIQKGFIGSRSTSRETPKPETQIPWRRKVYWLFWWRKSEGARGGLLLGNPLIPPCDAAHLIFAGAIDHQRNRGQSRGAAKPFVFRSSNARLKFR